MDMAQEDEFIRIRIKLPNGKLQTRYLSKEHWIHISALMAKVATEHPPGSTLICVNPYRRAK